MAELDLRRSSMSWKVTAESLDSWEDATTMAPWEVSLQSDDSSATPFSFHVRTEEEQVQWKEKLTAVLMAAQKVGSPVECVPYRLDSTRIPRIRRQPQPRVESCPCSAGILDTRYKHYRHHRRRRRRQQQRRRPHPIPPPPHRIFIHRPFDFQRLPWRFSGSIAPSAPFSRGEGSLPRSASSTSIAGIGKWLGIRWLLFYFGS